MENLSIKRKKAIRKALLSKLIRQIEGGEFSNIRTNPNKIYTLHDTVRQQYKNPLDRSAYNYGYMELDELGAGDPNIF